MYDKCLCVGKGKCHRDLRLKIWKLWVWESWFYM